MPYFYCTYFKCNCFHSLLQPHRDTEKVDKMFGTLVIQLPSDYDGGELRVRHRNEEQIFNFSGSKGVADCNYAAFYADCEHELCEVTRGYRLCLVYNLVYSGDDACPVPIDNSEVVAKVVEDMRKWEQDDDGPKLMAYILNHSYCEASLLFGLLKNGDRAKAEIILEAEKQSKFCLYLGIVSLRQHYSTGCGHRFSPEELTARDLDEEYLDALELVSPDGKLLDSIFISRDDIVPENVFESSEPNAQDFEPFTGNEGAKLDKSYHKAALFIWPTKHTILVTDSLDGAIENLNSKLCEPQTQQGECENLAKEIVAVSKNAHFYANEQSMITLLSCLKQLKARDLTCELFKGVGVHVKILKHQSFCEMVVELGNAFGWEQLEEALVALLESAVDINMKISCNFLSSLATGSLSSQRLNVCQKMVGVVCHALTNEQDNDSINSYYMYARSKEFVVELFKTLCALQYEDQLVVVIQSFFRQPNRYSLQNTLVPAAIELHQTMKENSTTALTSLISQCVTALEQLTLQAPNWFVQNDFVTCGCKLCTKLAEFLNDPQKKVARFLTDHGHLERQLERHCHKDISFTSNYHTPSRKILVQVTKKDDRFKAHQAKLELLERIRPLLNQKKQPVKHQKLVKSQKPPVRSQKPPVKSQKPPVKSQKPPVKRQKL